MEQEKYSLTWHTYSDHLKTVMKELMMNDDYSDVTLVTEDKKHIKANVNILSACSPVFKDMLKKENKSNPIIYLRGIQYSEMESIMQFIYLGEATFYEERMEEFIGVAKSLEIKNLCTSSQSSTIEMEEETITDHIKEQAPQDRIDKDSLTSIDNKNECEQCHKTFYDNSTLNRHKHSVHEGVKFDCDHCDYQATSKNGLNRHIRSFHEEVKYACDQCDYQARQPSSLPRHIRSMHEGVKYDCNHCDYQAKHRNGLYYHIQSKHKGFKYSCIHCDHQASSKRNLISHVNNKHASTKNE